MKCSVRLDQPKLRDQFTKHHRMTIQLPIDRVVLYGI